MLKIKNVIFEENTNTRDTGFFIHHIDRNYEISLDIDYLENLYNGEECSPNMCINSFETNTNQLTDLVGQEFSVKNIETALEREDTFYFYEHEPFVEYTLKVLGIENKKIHIECKGTAVIDGYADPYETAKFELDCWLPIITSAKDWESLGL